MKSISLLLVLLIGFNQDIQANFKIKNRSGENITIAIGYIEDGIWYTEGWWTIKDKESITIYNKPLKNRYYYYYAKSRNFLWQGVDSLFVDTIASYKLKLDSHLTKEKFSRIGFRVVDVKNKANYTLTLTEEIIKYRKKLFAKRRSWKNAVLCPRF